jgi:hypothetical protein
MRAERRKKENEKILKCLCFLLAFKDELHLISIENTVVKNKRE